MWTVSSDTIANNTVVSSEIFISDVFKSGAHASPPLRAHGAQPADARPSAPRSGLQQLRRGVERGPVDLDRHVRRRGGATQRRPRPPTSSTARRVGGQVAADARPAPVAQNNVVHEGLIDLYRSKNATVKNNDLADCACPQAAKPAGPRTPAAPPDARRFARASCAPQTSTWGRTLALTWSPTTGCGPAAGGFCRRCTAPVTRR